MVFFEIFGLTRDVILNALGLQGIIPTIILELLDIFIMAFAVGYIFEGFFGNRVVSSKYDPIAAYRKKGFDMDRLKFSIYAIAPAVVIHELFHKLASLSLGVPATFFASYGGLAIGIILKVVGSGIIFFVPGFVSISSALPSQGALIAFAGPFANLLLWLGSWYALKNPKNLSTRTCAILRVSKRVNLFLFFFNMIPFPPFDGGHVFLNLLRMF
jgi:Zn-dependent protease